MGLKELKTSRIKFENILGGRIDFLVSENDNGWVVAGGRTLGLSSMELRMEFLSGEVHRHFVQYQTVSFGEARAGLEALLRTNPGGDCRIEALSLLFHIDAERDSVEELEKIYSQALEIVEPAKQLKGSPALYHLGIVFLLCDELEYAEQCFDSYLAMPGAHQHCAKYGLAAVAYTRRESGLALEILDEIEQVHEQSSDFLCLVRILRGNCLRTLGRVEEALSSYLLAQKTLPFARAFYLKNWVFFGLGSIHARRGDVGTARTFFEVVVSITHPTDFRRLHKLASDELSRLEMRVEVLFDPVSGDLISNRGVMSLRRKPTLISIMACLMDKWPSPLSKESLYSQVWGGDYHPLRHDGLIYSHMQRLRHILTGDSKLKDFVLTTQEGYRLNPDISVRVKRAAKETAYEATC